MKTAKFGGTSLADAARFRQVRRILEADPEIQFVAVSAPGKRALGDRKITDLLYDCYTAVTRGEAPDRALRPAAERLLAIAAELTPSLDLEPELHRTAAALSAGASADYCASRGEYFCGKILAAYMGWPFADPADCIFFDSQGNLDAEKADEALRRRLRGLERAVMPGFYGGTPDGGLRTFTRGGSDISGALLARATGSRVYENWTDVPGILRADPRVVPEAAPISVMTYDEIRELAYMGANVFHEEAVRPARAAGIPIHVRDTLNPAAPGTRIVARAEEAPGPITGIAGRPGYAVIQIEKERMNGAVGYCRRILSALEKNEVPFEHLATGNGSVSLVAPADRISRCREALEEDIRMAVCPDSLHIENGLAIIAVVGRGMAGRPMVAGRLLGALGRAGISVRMIDQGTQEMNIVLGLSEKDYASAMAAIYRAFFGEDCK